MVFSEEGEALAKRRGALFCEVSSKTRENVRKPFIEVVDRIVLSPQLASLLSRGDNDTIELSRRRGIGASLCSC